MTRYVHSLSSGLAKYSGSPHPSPGGAMIITGFIFEEGLNSVFSLSRGHNAIAAPNTWPTALRESYRVA